MPCAAVSFCHCMPVHGQVSAVHMTETYAKTVIFMDRNDSDTSFYAFSWEGEYVKKDLAWAQEYNLVTRESRPLRVRTNPFCSAGFFLPNATLVNSAGNDGGRQSMRVIPPCNDKSCDFNLSREYQYRTARYGTVQYSTAQYSMAQYSTDQDSTVVIRKLKCSAASPVSTVTVQCPTEPRGVVDQEVVPHHCTRNSPFTSEQ